MTATIPFFNPVSQIRLAPGSIVTIPNISWQEFELILQQLGENRSARTPIHYLKLLNIWRISKCRNPYFFVKCFAL